MYCGKEHNTEIKFALTVTSINSNKGKSENSIYYHTKI